MAYRPYFLESNLEYQVILKRPIDKNILNEITDIINQSNAKLTDNIELGETIFEVSFDSNSSYNEFTSLLKKLNYFGKIAKV